MRYKVGVVSPSRTMTEQFKEEIAKHNLHNFLVRQARRDETLENAKELIAEGARVFICRGQPAHIIRNSMDVPVVDVRYTFYDCFNAYRLAKEHCDKVAFLVTYEPLAEAVRKSLFLMEKTELIYFRDMDNTDAIQEKLLDLKQRGFKAVVAGLTLIERVESLGLKCIMTQTDHDSVREAINEANHLLRIEKERDERAQELQSRYKTIVSIFECVSDAVLSIDKKGIITNINNKATQILGDHAIGRAISDVLHTGIFDEILPAGSPITGEIIQFHQHPLVVNAEPIRVNDAIDGATVTLQQPKHILAAEQKIRSVMIDKGHKSQKNFDDIVGASDTLQETKSLARKYAAADSTLFIFGETGTGKELFAQSIHNASRRRDAPFVAINCASLPLNILESELFGYVKGAFTGARSEGKAGFFEMAHHGTMFLDEISETPLEVQLKLLRILQERKTMRIGDDKLIPIDVRIVTASNRDLRELIRKGLFREDLYYRICVLELQIPPLRERPGDIPDLVRHFMRQSTPSVTRIAPDALRLLVSQEWPGNVRQLQNLFERVGAICEGNAITRDMVEKALGGGAGGVNAAFGPPTGIPVSPQGRAIDSIKNEQELIRQVLLEVKGNRKLAAKRLGISTTTLWRSMKRITDKDETYFDMVKYGMR